MLARYSRWRRGFTLVEMMIAMIITMMMVFSMVEAFRWIGDATTDGRAQIEMLGQIRAARYRLEKDLAGITVPLRPWADPQAYPGYFELAEGISTDRSVTRYLVSNNATPQTFNFADANNTLAAASSTLFGDLDDILMFTARNDEEPFRGRFEGNIIESNMAEIIWWTSLNDKNANGIWEPGETFNLHRRVLLIRPDLNDQTAANSPNYVYSGNVTTFLANNDISVHNSGSNRLVANSAADLAERHNRTAHNSQRSGTRGLDNTNYIGALLYDSLPTFASNSNMTGEDVILTNVLAFDLRVWEPNAPLQSESNLPISSTDPGFKKAFNDFQTNNAPNPIGLGDYVDLGVLSNDLTATEFSEMERVVGRSIRFCQSMQTKAFLPSTPYTYDTWSFNYERDGYDQNNFGGADESTNGFDDSNDGAIDDGAERETMPPYPYPLRSMKVSIRIYEPSTRQVRQMSHVVEFANE